MSPTLGPQTSDPLGRLAVVTTGGDTIRVYIEQGPKRAFACALDWPGWCRVAKSEDAALEALDAYWSRYQQVAALAGQTLPRAEFEVVEHVKGGATTDFGAPERVASHDLEPLKPAEATKLADLVEAAWAELDAIYAKTPEHLIKGPRGGGRDREKMLAHVLAAESAYLRKVGLKHRQPDNEDADAIAAMRADLLATLRQPSQGGPVVEKGWPPRYAARRVAWHVLDHAWEMEDKTPPASQ
jgi:hypothetical protein